MIQIETPRVKSVADVSRALQRGRNQDESSGWGNTVFLVGAGCSASAGIPLAREIAGECVLDLARRYSNARFDPKDVDHAFGWLQENKHFGEGVTWDNAYGYIFESHYADPTEQQRIVQDAIGRARGINWFHLCLGELIAKRYVNTVLTTNFDQMVLEGVVRTGLIPVVADGIESLSRISGQPRHPQVVHLHGSMHTYNPRNSTTAVREPEDHPAASSTLYNLLHRSSALIVVGYAGGEEAVMTLLSRSASLLRDKTIYWLLREDNWNRLSPRAQTFLSLSRNSGVVLGQDADELMRQIMQDLHLGGPEWMLRPIVCLQKEARRIAPPQHRDLASELDLYLKVLEDLLASHREERGAVAVARRLRLAGDLAGALEWLRPAAWERDDPEIWLTLGATALELGRKRDVALVSEAAEAFSQALRHYRLEESPEEWATCQVHIGQALITIGKRKGDPKLLKDAVQALQAALEIRSRDAAPEVWASIQRDLGVALRHLGQQETSLERLQESTAAFRAALEVTSREAAPLRWGDIQNSLGNALVDVGVREQGTERLCEAVAAYRCALEVFSREQTPEQWALAQSNLGNALATIGARGEGTEPLNEGIRAFELALQAQSPESLPFGWARTQNNLGNALRLLGEREKSRDHLQSAIRAHSAALEIRKKETMPADWAVTTSNLGNTLLTLGRLTGEMFSMEEALRAYERALEVRTRDRSLIDWALTQNNIGEALTAIGEKTGDSVRLEQGIAAYQRALEIFEKDQGSQHYSQAVRDNLQDAQSLLAKIRPAQ